MNRIHHLRLEPLTEEAFRPFGEVIDVKSRPPDQSDGGSRGWWLGFEASGQPLLAVVEVDFTGFRFSRLERHFGVTQAFVPLHGPPAAVAVAAPTDPDDRDAIPDPGDVRAFLLDGSKGYVLGRGTWHSLDRYPLRERRSVFVMLTDRMTAEDLVAPLGPDGWRHTQEIDYAARFGTMFELSPPTSD